MRLTTERTGKCCWRILQLASLGLLLLGTCTFIYLVASTAGSLRTAKISTGASGAGRQFVSELQRVGTALSTLPQDLASYRKRYADYSTADLPKVDIELKFNELEHLNKLRAQALKDGLLVKTPESFVRATMSIDGDRIKTELRLKGDL